MSNILFILFHDFTSNSAYHVHSFANSLSELGCSCAVVVPDAKHTIEAIGTAPRYTHHEFADFDRAPPLFPNGRGPDIVHCWTPREAVRRFYERTPYLHAAKLFIHLEDNEWEVAARTLNRSLGNLDLQTLDALIAPNLSHPIRARQFMERAHGVTVLMEKLKEMAPAGKPAVEIWPSADAALYGPRPINWDGRERLGIARETTVIVYTGNVHAANATEVKSLYLAVAMLNREGHPALLIRTGRDFCPFLGDDAGWAHKATIELGFVERKALAGILAMANLFVQPGRPGLFNDYRFPSKIPEFCAIGRPVILPASNIGLAMRHLEDAYIVPQATATAIVEAVQNIRANSELEQRLAAGAERFFTAKLCWRRSASKLLDFYHFERKGMTAPLLGPPPIDSPAPIVRNSKF